MERSKNKIITGNKCLLKVKGKNYGRRRRGKMRPGTRGLKWKPEGKHLAVEQSENPYPAQYQRQFVMLLHFSIYFLPSFLVELSATEQLTCATPKREGLQKPEGPSLIKQIVGCSW
jgi:hypothetical protein